MDINTIRSVITVVMFVMFVGIVIWAFSKRRKKDFDEAAHLPFDEDEDNDDQSGHGSKIHGSKK